MRNVALEKRLTNNQDYVITSIMKTKWGGKRPGSGRPANTGLPPDKRKSKIVYIRMTLAQWAEYVRRGGADWLRSVLE